MLCCVSTVSPVLCKMIQREIMQRYILNYYFLENETIRREMPMANYAIMRIEKRKLGIVGRI